MKIVNYDRNPYGKDFFVGDIHGEYEKLEYALFNVGFNKSCDRLWSVGDLVDRGPESLKCLSLTDHPWFYAVKGNHEQIMIDATTMGDEQKADQWKSVSMWLENGGEWYSNLSSTVQEYADYLIGEADKLPNGIRVGDIGVIHAECPLCDWDLLAIDQGEHLKAKAMWARTRISYGVQSLVQGVTAVVVGHSPVKDVTVLGNHVYIDQGACFYPDRGLTILSYDEIIELVKK
jgi:serine/threonine protein phosphatase 1